LVDLGIIGDARDEIGNVFNNEAREDLGICSYAMLKTRSTPAGKKRGHGWSIRKREKAIEICGNNHCSIPQRFQIALSLPFASVLIHNAGSRGFSFSSPSKLNAARPR
jgi:hypothetical protein